MALHQASMCFEMDDVRPFLGRLAELLDDGFGADEIQRVWQAAETLAVDEEAQLGFLVRWHGQTVPLHVTVFMDAVATPELLLFSHPEPAAEIDRLMDDFFAERGR